MSDAGTSEHEVSLLLEDAKRSLDRVRPRDASELRATVGPVVRSITRLWSELNPSFDSDAWYVISALLSEYWPEISAFQSKVIDMEWNNPWLGLGPSEGQIVHPADAPQVAAFNAALSPARTDVGLITSAWPEPWMGPAINASVLVLGANPGWAGAADMEVQERLVHLARANLSGREPLVWLNGQADGTPAATWYRTRLLKDVLAAPGIEEQTVARSLAVVDFHAYHAARWQALPVTLPTQRSTFALVRQRLADDALVVLTRCAFDWCVAIPELLNHPNVFRTKSRQNPRLSQNNLGDEAWAALVERLGGR